MDRVVQWLERGRADANANQVTDASWIKEFFSVDDGLLHALIQVLRSARRLYEAATGREATGDRVSVAERGEDFGLVRQGMQFGCGDPKSVQSWAGRRSEQLEAACSPLVPLGVMELRMFICLAGVARY